MTVEVHSKRTGQLIARFYDVSRVSEYPLYYNIWCSGMDTSFDILKERNRVTVKGWKR